MDRAWGRRPRARAGPRAARRRAPRRRAVGGRAVRRRAAERRLRTPAHPQRSARAVRRARRPGPRRPRPKQPRAWARARPRNTRPAARTQRGRPSRRPVTRGAPRSFQCERSPRMGLSGRGDCVGTLPSPFPSPRKRAHPLADHPVLGDMMTTESAVEFPTPTRVHVALAARDVSQAIAFYRALLGQEPTKVRPGYAKFEVLDPPLNLALNETPEATAPPLPQHFGIQVKRRAAIAELASRLAAQGFRGAAENQVTCCYAVQDKI